MTANKDMEKAQLLKPSTNPSNTQKSLASQCASFFALYIVFDIASYFVMIAMYPFLDTIALFKDSSFIIAIALYGSLILILLALLGVAVGEKNGKNWSRPILISLPVVILGWLTWFVGFQNTRDINVPFGDFFSPWVFYSLYFIWIMPVFDLLKDYLDQDRIVTLAAFIPLLPGLLGAIGMRLAGPAIPAGRKKKLIGGALLVPGLLLVALPISGGIPIGARFTPATYPKVDGATAALPLGKVLAGELLGWSKRRADRAVRFNTTHEAYLNLIHKRADLIFVAGPSDAELREAKANRVSLKLTPLGKDAFVFLTHRDASVANLSIEQIRGIYTGKITNWKEVGGEDEPIAAYQRDENSGSQTFMEKKVMQGLPLADPPLEHRIDGMGGLVDAVADYKNARNAIGYSFYYYANQMHQRNNVKFLAVAGVDCNKTNIINDRYPFTAILYAVTREGEPAGSPADRLLQLLLGAEGRRLIEKGGFVPLH